MQFQPLRAEDRERIAPFFDGLLSRTCDLTPGTLLMWREVNFTEFAIEDGSLFLRVRGSDGGARYLLPLGTDVREAVKRLVSEEKQAGVPMIFVLVPSEYKEAFDAFEGALAVPCREYFDYLYRAEDLVTLSGKKYAKKRNLIRQFEREYPFWHAEAITEENLPAVRAFFTRFEESLPESESHVEALERRAVSCVLSEDGLCGMYGVVLSVGEQIVGFSLGERMGDTLFTHVEKAERAYKGVYQKLTNLFTGAEAEDGILFVNREDDSGDEGLRRAKLDYHPCALLEKYRITIQ